MQDIGSSPTVSRSDWSIPDGITYLNHGSFGPTPRVVQAAREEWSRRLSADPMGFFLRELDGALDTAAARLGKWIGADPRDLVFVDNATVGMNVVAESVKLEAGDEVLLNDHEYGAVFRIWRAACDRVGAKIISPAIGTGDDSQPRRFQDVSEIVQPIVNAITSRTKLIVISHVTSPTAMVFPVEEICSIAKSRGVPICIDGPHAIAMRPLNLQKLECDYYCASLHKWLSAPLGSGFLYVRRKWQQKLKPHLTSWGRSLGGCPPRWQDELNWLGTRDPAPFLAVPAAIDFLERTGVEKFRQQTHALAQYARGRLEQILGQTATIPNSIDWYASMIAVPLPPDSNKKSRPNAIHPLQQELWDQHQMEILVTECHGHRYLRVSCHLYNTLVEIDQLCVALQKWLEDLTDGH